ncbi:Cof-type HAD-IIB family hydrolase [Lactovum odontotermitis]
MPIKLIAVDMDGTFLNDEKTYNIGRFVQIFRRMQSQGIRFVVASDNQYFQLRSFFPEDYQKISFVAENGANIVIGDLPFYHEKINTALVKKTLRLFEEKIHPQHYVIGGEKSAYISDNVPDNVFSYASFYNPRIKRLADIREVINEKDDLFKFALNFKEEEAADKLKQLAQHLGGALIAVSSGHGDVDLILPDVNKFTGLCRLGKEWGISKDEMMAFGDSGNDFEMIKGVKYGVVMENGQPALKSVAWKVIPSNNTEALLDMIEQVLDGQIS